MATTKNEMVTVKIQDGYNQKPVGQQLKTKIAMIKNRYDDG